MTTAVADNQVEPISSGVDDNTIGTEITDAVASVTPSGSSTLKEIRRKVEALIERMRDLRNEKRDFLKRQEEEFDAFMMNHNGEMAEAEAEAGDIRRVLTSSFAELLHLDIADLFGEQTAEPEIQPAPGTRPHGKQRVKTPRSNKRRQAKARKSPKVKTEAGARKTGKTERQYVRSPEARERMAQAQRDRWAKKKQK